MDLLKQIGDKIQSFLKLSQPEVKLEKSDTLQDGTPVIFEPDFTQGAVVMVTTAEGTQPAADGEYTLAGGQSFTVSGGLVASITEAMNEEKELEQVLDEMLSAKLSEANKANADLLVELNATKESMVKLGEIVNEMYSLLSTIATPAPTQPVQQSSSKTDDRIASLKQNLAKVKEANGQNSLISKLINKKK